ncbi:gibberellin receptor GID1L2 [Panicum miliaceum]|uniref:Gibberellin receptor GID1L2 n=1 Tax=Panicum miliaceum TaxID=4540 RepID=A0A3L6RJX0_PANMI|nr:gibberellin receptor GID1L2 [Panicum miliaceum]
MLAARHLSLQYTTADAKLPCPVERQDLGSPSTPGPSSNIPTATARRFGAHKPDNHLAGICHRTTALAMDPDAEVTFEFVPVIRQYKSGRVERLLPVNPVPPSVDAASRDVTVDAATGLRARLYLPDLPPGGGAGGRLPVVLYFHGGGLVAGSAADAPEHAFLNRLAALAVSVEYRLAPEHPVPACYDDARAALLWATAAAGAGAEADPWVRDRGDAARVFVLGFSVGGNVAHNLAVRAGSEPGLLPRGARVEGVALLHSFFLSSHSRPADHEFHLREPESAKAVLLMDRLVAGAVWLAGAGIVFRVWLAGAGIDRMIEHF